MSTRVPPPLAAPPRTGDVRIDDWLLALYQRLGRLPNVTEESPQTLTAAQAADLTDGGDSTDIIMPNVDGYELTRALRMMADYANSIPRVTSTPDLRRNRVMP